MDGLLIPVSMLETKLGKSLGAPDSAKYRQAEQTIWTVSVRARSVADKSDTEWVLPEDIPNLVKTHVLEASFRVFKNPNRYLNNAAVSMSAGLSPNELNGDIFLSAERADLEGFRDTQGLWTISTTRGAPNSKRDSRQYVSTSDGHRFPYYGPGEG